MTHDQSPDSVVGARSAAVESEYARRSVLRGALALGAVGIGGALAGCGGGSSPVAGTSAAAAPAAAAPAAAAPAAAAPAAAAPAAAAPAKAAPAKAAPADTGGKKGASLGPASAIPVGGGVIYDTAKVVVTQPTAGVYKAFSAICTHQQCILADVQGGTINCACHGAKFSITDGSVVKPPATEPLTAKTVTVAGGKVSVT